MASRVLLLTSSTGGGHDMRARSFKAWAEHPAASHLGLEVKIFHALESIHPIYRFGVGLYNWIQRVMPRLHHLYYNYLELLPSCHSARWLLGKKRLLDVFNSFSPDIIVSVHDHLNHGFFELAQKASGGHVRCVTYCGELFGNYGFSRHWVNPASDLFIGAVDETCVRARELGMADSRCWQGGFMLSPAFACAKLDKKERDAFIRQILGLDPRRFILLLATGANGANHHLSLLRAMYREALHPQVVVLCGRNQSTKKALERWGQEHPELPIVALGYTDQMCELLQVSSAIVARPGTGTTSEALLNQCPLIFNGIGGIMPQERITVEFSQQHKFGRVIKRPNDLVKILKLWIQKPALLAQQRQAMAAATPAFQPIRILEQLVVD